MEKTYKLAMTLDSGEPYTYHYTGTEEGLERHLEANQSANPRIIEILSQNDTTGN